MKNYYAKAIVVMALLTLVLAAGCEINISCGGCGGKEKYKRTVQLTGPVETGGTFTAETHNGAITVQGAEVADCNLIATITAGAKTEEDAKEIAEQTKITLQPSGDGLVAEIQKPKLTRKQSICVSFEAIVPTGTGLRLTTHNGTIKITNIKVRTQAQTHNGSIIATGTAVSTNLHTHNGSIKCEDVSGDIKVSTHNGNATAVYSGAAPPVCDISMSTHNGNIKLTAPQNLSATVDVSTHNGSISTDLPITVKGKLTKSKLVGTIGAGEGSLHLDTHNGSIKIK